MSRIGNKNIPLPAGVQIEVGESVITVKGPKGTLTAEKFGGLNIEQLEGALQVSRTSEDKEVRSKHGLLRSLLNNNVIGVTNGFQKTLILQGVGYRAQKKGEALVMNLGFSHEVKIDIPSDVKVDCPEPTKVIVSGIDKQRVGQIASDIRSKRPPEPYKGKGIRYEDEQVKRKAGKAGKK